MAYREGNLTHMIARTYRQMTNTADTGFQCTCGMGMRI